MKIVYLFTDKTKKLTEYNLYKIDSMIEAYELIIDFISMEIQRENNFTDKEIKEMMSADIIDLHEGNYARIIDWNGKTDPVKIANQDYKAV